MTPAFQQALAVQDKQPPLTDRGRRTRDNLLQSARTVFEPGRITRSAGGSDWSSATKRRSTSGWARSGSKSV